jgi:hypothetical protein
MQEKGYSPLFYIGLIMLIVGVLGFLVVGAGAGGM